MPSLTTAVPIGCPICKSKLVVRPTKSPNMAQAFCGDCNVRLLFRDPELLQIPIEAAPSAPSPPPPAPIPTPRHTEPAEKTVRR